MTTILSKREVEMLNDAVKITIDLMKDIEHLNEQTPENIFNNKDNCDIYEGRESNND